MEPEGGKNLMLLFTSTLHVLETDFPTPNSQGWPGLKQSRLISPCNLLLLAQSTFWLPFLFFSPFPLSFMLLSPWRSASPFAFLLGLPANTSNIVLFKPIQTCPRSQTGNVNEVCVVWREQSHLTFTVRGLRLTRAAMHYFTFFNVMLFQEDKIMNFHLKSPEIINVGKRKHI